jgi:uncharacterized protein DUF6112/type IV secretion system pilin
MKYLAFILAQSVDMKPDFSVIPGSNTLQRLVNGAGALALILSMLGIVVGGGLWGVGSLSSNHHAATIGKRATLYSVVGVMIVGAAALLVRWAFGLGQAAS